MTGEGKITLLDGGMGRLLARMGAPFRLPEWSALALIEAPDLVARAHDAFIAAGAEIITTNSYSVLPHQIGEARFTTEGQALAARAGRIAREAVARAAHPVRVAGSIPPLFESYRPDLFDAARAPAILETLVTGLAPHIDLWLIETQSSIEEASAAITAVAPSGLPIWVSFTLRDEAGRRRLAELRSGAAIETAVAAMRDRGAEAVLFNCSQPEVMQASVEATAALRDRPARLGVYANAFIPEAESDDPYAGISRLRDDVTPARYLDWVRGWIAAGADIVGGCCGIFPEHIAAIRAATNRTPGN